MTANARSPRAPEFRRQMVELVPAGRRAEDRPQPALPLSERGYITMLSSKITLGSETPNTQAQTWTSPAA